MELKAVSLLKGRFHYGYVIVACCCLMMGVNIGLTFSCAGIFYGPVSSELQVPIGEFGLYMSIMYITSTLTLPFAGTLVERKSARWLFSGASALMGVTFALMALANQLFEFYIAGGILGITLAFLLYLSFPTLVNRWFSRRVGLMIGICSAASGIGGVLFNPVAGFLIANFGWRIAYGSFSALILLVVTPLLAILLRDKPSDIELEAYGAGEDSDARTGVDKSSSRMSDLKGPGYSSAIRLPVLYGLMFFSFIMMGTSTLNLFIPDYASTQGCGIEEASLVASMAMVGVTVGKLALGWINDRNCMAGVVVTTVCGILGLLALTLGGGSFWLLYLGAFLFGWEYAGVTVQSTMLTKNVFGTRDYARIYSMISIALAAGGAIASGGWGLLADSFGFNTIFTVGAVTLAVALVLGIWGCSVADKPGPNGYNGACLGE